MEHEGALSFTWQELKDELSRSFGTFDTLNCLGVLDKLSWIRKLNGESEDIYDYMMKVRCLVTLVSQNNLPASFNSQLSPGLVTH